MEVLLALDPGQTTGWALFDMQGTVLRMGESAYPDKLYNLLTCDIPDIYVVEQFRVRTRRAGEEKNMRYVQEFDLVPAARAIGAIETWAVHNNRPVYFQEPTIMSRSAQMFGLPMNRSHQLNAALHGLWWLHHNRELMPMERPIIPNEEPIRGSTQIVSLGEGESMRKALRRAKKR